MIVANESLRVFLDVLEERQRMGFSNIAHVKFRYQFKPGASPHRGR